MIAKSINCDHLSSQLDHSLSPTDDADNYELPPPTPSSNPRQPTVNDPIVILPSSSHDNGRLPSPTPCSSRSCQTSEPNSTVDNGYKTAIHFQFA